MTNLEFKARLRNPATILQILTKYEIPLAATLHQTDTYFHVPTGRLKLREFDGEMGQLIFYTRPDRAAVKRSDYFMAPIASPTELREVLAMAYGIRAVVKKTRELYRLPRKLENHLGAPPSRLHLDMVEGLGQFLEIEVLLQEGESPQLAEEEARAWLEEFGIATEDLVAGSYADLLEAQTV